MLEEKQTLKTLTRLLLKEKSDLGLHCLLRSVFRKLRFVMEDRKRSSMVVKSNQAGHTVNQFSFVHNLFSQYSQDRRICEYKSPQKVPIDSYYIVAA